MILILNISHQNETMEEVESNVHTVNQNKEPISYIQQYAVYEHLGSGAFGSVYKVMKSYF